MYNMAGDLWRFGRTIADSTYLPKLESGLFSGYENAVRMNDGSSAEVWGRSVGAALTLNLSEVAISSYDVIAGKGTYVCRSELWS